ncbi:MAG: hydroxyacylglutathione hydrolase [Pseudomonadota bacterium]
MLKIKEIPAFESNYIWAIINSDSNDCAVVDPGDAAPVRDFVKTHHLNLKTILITHHHADHVGGVAQLCQDYDDLTVYGPSKENIPCLTHPLQQDDQIELPLLKLSLNILDVPGHTKGHIAYYNDDCLFIGDTLFSAGCGRMFEGTAQQFGDSLNKLKPLRAATKIYCAHEYTLANLKFAKAVEPDNKAIDARISECQALRAANQATIPSTIAAEKMFNPFLRCDVESVRQAAEQHAGKKLSNDIEVFAVLRDWKNHF